MKRLLAVFACVICIACDSSEREEASSWIKLGLDGLKVNELVIRDDNLYAATSDGIYRKGLNGDVEFKRIGLAGMNIEDLVIFSTQKILASYVDRTYAEAPGLYVTTNAGTDWTKVESDFGGSAPEPIFDLVADADDDDMLFAGGLGVVASSNDGGVSWTPIWGEWQRIATGVTIVTMSPYEKIVWAGGQGAIENGFIIRNPGREDERVWDNLLPNPTVAKEIVFNGPDFVLAGWEGGLIRSQNGGETWKTIIESDENRFFFGVALGNRPGRVYAGGWLKGQETQPLKLFVSDDSGDGWRVLERPNEDNGGIFDLQVQSSPKEDRIFLGLDQGGVYEVRIRN